VGRDSKCRKEARRSLLGGSIGVAATTMIALADLVRKLPVPGPEVGRRAMTLVEMVMIHDL
jgi:hypothetical protein